jgi:hypothetical protein
MPGGGAKRVLRKAIEWPCMQRRAFEALGLRPPGGAAPRPARVREDDAGEDRHRRGGRCLPLARARGHVCNIVLWKRQGWAQVSGAVHA